MFVATVLMLVELLFTVVIADKLPATVVMLAAIPATVFMFGKFVDINCFVNFNVFPGTQIFVDPAGWVPNLDSETLGELGSLQALTHFGLGGYYCVVGVDHTFGPGIFDSQIKAKWVMEIDSPNKPRYPEKPSKQSNNKCKEAAGSLAAAASRADESAIKSVGAELAAIPSRVKALAMSAIDLVAGGETGELVDKAASLFGNPSSAP